MSSEHSIAQQTQEKFHFYFLALIFTLLSAAIQTANFQRSTTEQALELAGWLGLLLAGLIGLWKLEWDSVIRIQLARRDEVIGAITDLKKQILQGVTEVLVISTGQMQSVNDRMKDHEDVMSIQSVELEKLRKRDMFKYTATKYSFLIGMVSLMGSRAAAAIVDMFGYKLL